MEHSEKRQKAIDLGKKLVEQLGGQRDTDFLMRWMAHYIGEQIVNCETAVGQKKIDAEERCFRTILALWEKRNHFPDGLRPLNGFEPIFRALSFLDLEQKTPYYLRSIRGGKPAKNKQDKAADDLVEFVASVDGAARSLIAMGMQEAIAKATTKKTKALLEQARLFRTDEDVELALRLKQMMNCDSPDPITSLEKHIENIDRCLKNIDQFGTACANVRPYFVKDLEASKLSREKARQKKRRQD